MDKAGVSASADDLHALLGLAVLRRDNGVQLPHRILHGVVDDKVIIGVGRLKLHFGPQQPLLDLLGAVGAPLCQAALQLRPAGGAMKMRTVSGRLLHTWMAPWISISRITSFPASMASSTNFLGVP